MPQIHACTNLRGGGVPDSPPPLPSPPPPPLPLPMENSNFLNSHYKLPKIGLESPLANTIIPQSPCGKKILDPIMKTLI